MESRVRDAFATLDPSGEMGEECWRLYAKKLQRWTANRARLESADWQSIAAQAARHLIEPSELAVALGSAGAPPGLSPVAPPRAPGPPRLARGHCHPLRERLPSP